MMTTRSSRGWAWVSTIPHWLYFTALRSNQPLWYRLLVWTSALACVLAVLGLVLGVTAAAQASPFQAIEGDPVLRIMRWHYISGVVFGVFTLTFAFSGLLSMEPWDWTERDRTRTAARRTERGQRGSDALRGTRSQRRGNRCLVASGQGVEFAPMLDEPY
jgi:hypothetical protein